jgi:hypothetical protein
MTRSRSNASERLKLRRAALSRWNNEGGAGSGGRVHVDSVATHAGTEIPPLTNAELVQLQIRVIALERIVVALLGQSTGAQLDLIRDMAAYIYPRAGRTRHRLTIGAAAQMINLVEDATAFRMRPVPSRRERRPRAGPGRTEG